MKIAIGNDHAGFNSKNDIISYLEKLGHSIINVGVDGDISTNYAIYGFKVANLVVDGEADFGIVVCSTGVGISISANRVRGARAVVCRTPIEAEIARVHFNANVLALGAQIQNIKALQMIIDKFLNTRYEANTINNKNQIMINNL